MHENFDNRLSGAVIAAAIDVHRELGPGLDELYYQFALTKRLTQVGLDHHAQMGLPLVYKGAHLDCGYRPDFVFPKKLIVELKSVEFILPVHEAQLITYLRLTGIELGLLINFDVPLLRDGIRRRVLSSHTEVESRSVSEDWATESPFEPASRSVLDAAYEVHRILGPGLLASAYEEALGHELGLRGVAVERQKRLPIQFGNVTLPKPFEVPLVAAGQLPVMCLAVEELNKLHEARLLALLRHGHWRSGLIFNFNVLRLKQGTRRIVNPQLRPQ